MIDELRAQSVCRGFIAGGRRLSAFLLRPVSGGEAFGQAAARLACSGTHSRGGAAEAGIIGLPADCQQAVTSAVTCRRAGP